jgi:dTDP-4-dehydrorhamnose reductase
MKIVVLGSGGQLGRDLTPRLPGEVLAWTRAEADLTRPRDLRAALEAARPDAVVNCAAYNLVDRAESRPEDAFAVNAWGVAGLAAACRDLGCTLVHFSTWHEFAAAIFDLAGVTADLTPITSAEYDAAARRPGYSVLANTAYAAAGLPSLRPWREALAAYLAERNRRNRT